MGAVLGLSGRLLYLASDLFSGRHTHVPVLVTEQKAIFEQLFHMHFGGLYFGGFSLQFL